MKAERLSSAATHQGGLLSAVHGRGAGDYSGHRHGHVERYLLAAATCVPDAAQKVVFDRYHATRYVKKETAGSLHLDLVRDNGMPDRNG